MFPVLRTLIIVSLMFVVPSHGDVEQRPPTTIAGIAKLEGVKVDYRMKDRTCYITIRLDPGNVFIGANNATFARLHLKDGSGEMVGSVEIRNRFDFPEGQILGPFKGGTRGQSLYFEFSCREAALTHSEIYFYNTVARSSPSQRVALRDLPKTSK